MSSNSALPNTWIVVSVDENTNLSYAPRVNPSPLTVGSGMGSLEIVITNPTDLDIDVKSVDFTIKVAGPPPNPSPYPDSNALTTTTANVKAIASASDSQWMVELPDATVTHGDARYRLKPVVGLSSKIPGGGFVVVQIYGFPINVVSGTSTIKIKEDTEKGFAFPSFTVTTFPWGFAFNDLVASVHDDTGWKPVAQVENEQSVTLFWHGSVVDKGSYTIYYSDSQGQQTCKPTSLGQWLSPALYADTVFTLGVVTSNSVGEPLYASMSIAVAVRNPDLMAKSVKAQTAEAGSATITNLDVLATTMLKGDLTVGLVASRPKLTVYTSPLVIDSAANVVLMGNSLTFGAGTNTLVVDKTRGLSVTGPLTVTGPLSLTSGLKMSDANAVIQRGDGNITAGDLGLYSNNLTNGIRLVTNKTPIKFFTDGGNGTNPALTINADGTLEAQGQYGSFNLSVSSDPSTKLWFSSHAYRGKSNYDNNAEICNDVVNSYGKALMLCGNSSRKLTGPRWVQVWDNLEVKGELFVGQKMNVYLADYNNGTWWSLGWRHGNNYVWWDSSSGGSMVSVSDLRLKSEVRPVPSALDKVRRLSGITFRWNEDAMQHFTSDIETNLSAGPNATGAENQKVWQTERDKRRTQLSMTQVGIVAQDVEAVLPEAVTTDADGYKSVRYDNLIPLLIEAIKEQDQLAARQQGEIERLKLALGMNESEVSK